MKKDIRIIFENIKNKYGDVSSWAIWKAPYQDNLVSNMEVDGLFDLTKNPSIINQLKNNIIMVGYNFSISTDNFPKFHNFHTYNGANINHTTLRNASKIRHAFIGTPYYGAHMTDIIKNYVEPHSEKVEFTDINDNLNIFRQEMGTLHADKPTIIAFGSKVHKLLNKHIKQNEYSKLIEVTHYAHYGDGCATHEGYRKKVLYQLTNK
jgi:hypothetical protein